MTLKHGRQEVSSGVISGQAIGGLKELNSGRSSNHMVRALLLRLRTTICAGVKINLKRQHSITGTIGLAGFSAALAACEAIAMLALAAAIRQYGSPAGGGCS
jgi:hypothetical protein